MEYQLNTFVKLPKYNIKYLKLIYLKLIVQYNNSQYFISHFSILLSHYYTAIFVNHGISNH